MPTAKMGLTLPTVGGSTGTWGATTNANEEIIDSHRHIVGEGNQIPTAGLALDADLTFAGHAAINLKGAGFTAQAVAPTIQRCCWVDNAGDLYYRNAAGTSVQITSGGQIDVSSVGGITGDYAAAGASFYYDDANKTYRALRQAPLPNFWASLSAGDLDLYEKASGITNRVRLKSPAALAASYDFTLPTALPGAAAILQSSAAGVLSYNSTANRAPVGATTLDANGAVAFSSTVALGTQVAAFTSTGAITATDFKQSTARITKIPALACNFFGSSVAIAADMSYVDMSTGTATIGAAFPLVLDIGERITKCVAKVNKTSVSGTLSFRLKKFNHSTGVLSNVGSASNSANNPGKIDLDTGVLAEDMASGFSYWFEFQRSTSVAGDLIYEIEVSHTRP